ncbi:hypothetical protein PO909_025924 [Leuciscus waleckii]
MNMMSAAGSSDQLRDGSTPNWHGFKTTASALEWCFRVTSLRWISERKPHLRTALQRDELEFEDADRIAAFARCTCCGAHILYSAPAVLSDGDSHVLCASCLGKDHADHVLADGGCQECESLPLSTLRAQQALFIVKSASPIPSVGPRRKKRHSQRPPEPSVKENSPAASLRASFSESLISFLDGQRPAAVEMMERDVMEDDSCSLLASGSEEWSGSIPDPAPSTQESSVRALVNAELLHLFTKAVEDLGLEWTTPQEPAPNRLDGCFLTGRRSAPVSRPAPFLPELHDELSRLWGAPYSARLRSSVSSTLSAVDGAKDRGYLSVPPVEEAVATHLCPPSAGWRAKSTLPTARAWKTGSLRLTANQTCFTALKPWMITGWYQTGVNLGAASQIKVVSTDASNTGWGTLYEGRPSMGLWSLQKSVFT